MSESTVVYIGTSSEPWEMSQSRPRTWRKELIHAGTFTKRQGNAVQRFTVDDALLHHWANTFAKMREAGVEVPLPIEHTTDPEKTRGKVVRLEVAKNKKGVDALFGDVVFVDEDAERLAASADVSIHVPRQFTDGHDTTYFRPIRHVALTNYPVIPGLEGFEAVAASFEGEMSMSLQSLAEKMAIPVADKDDPAVEAEILMQIQAMQQKIASLTEELAKATGEESPDEGEDEGEGEDDNATPPAIAASHQVVKLIRENRSMKLRAAMEKGLLTPAAAKKIEAVHCTQDALVLSLSSDKDDGFDAMMDMLEANGQVLSFKEKSSGQGISLGDAGKGDVKVPDLIADAKARAEAHKR